MKKTTGGRISFTGASGVTRHGTIEKVWHSPGGTPWAHVRADRVFIWEHNSDLVFVVCLASEADSYNKCVIH